MSASKPPKAKEPSETDDSKYIARKYYLEPRQVKAITIKTILGDHDRSAVVRAALDMYLADILANESIIDR